MSLLEGDIAEMVADGLMAADLPYEITITRMTEGTPRPPDHPSWEPWDDEAVEVKHACMGFVDTYSAFLVASGVVDAGDVKIVLLQTQTPVVPLLTDTITARGKVYTALEISEDPAKATYEIRARA